MMALVGGLIALILGIIGIIVWWGYFLKALMAGIPVMLILGGALATYLGVEEIKDKKASESFDDTEKDDLKKEVDSLKQEIKDLKDKTEDQPES
jgi:cell division protein FtsB